MTPSGTRDKKRAAGRSDEDIFEYGCSTMATDDNKQVTAAETIDYRNRSDGRSRCPVSITLVVNAIIRCAGRRLDAGRPIARLLSS